MPSTLQLRAFATATTTATTMIGTSDTAAVTTAAEMMPSLAQELARELSLSCPDPDREMAIVARYHNHEVGPHQCCSAVVRRIAAPVDAVWGLVRRFDEPQTYKHFLRSCRVIAGDGSSVGCLREVKVVSGLPADTSTERLEVFDEECHAIGFRVIGGDHRLQNYRSATTVHPSAAGGSVVVESYVVDVPPGNTKEETCTFADTIVRCNLQNLSQIAERIAARSSPSPPSTPSSSAPSSSTTPSTTSAAASSSCRVS